MESFGRINFAMAVTEREGRMALVLRNWDIAGLPLPRFLLPSSSAFEHGADGRFNFDVDISLPLFGRVVHYQGWLEAGG